MTYYLLAAGLPIIITICVLKALKGTKITRFKEDDCPTALKISFLEANKDSSWHLQD